MPDGLLETFDPGFREKINVFFVREMVLYAIDTDDISPIDVEQ
ncbi:hypothetical protein [Bombella mellum]|nr:hypothetical protein [Bombella mellum]